MSSQARETYLALPDQQKIRFLAVLAHQLTVCARGAYPGQAPAEVGAGKLMTYNEIQHQVSSMLGHLIRGSSKRYPDDVFLNIIEEKAAAGGCVDELRWALDFAASRCPAPHPAGGASAGEGS